MLIRVSFRILVKGRANMTIAESRGGSGEDYSNTLGVLYRVFR